MSVYLNFPFCIYDHTGHKTLPTSGSENMLGEDPDFKEIIPSMKLRRMNFLVKRSIYCTHKVLESAGIEVPEGVICGTGMGSLEYTENFLKGMIENQEKHLNPSFFIASTHNTISSQVAIHLKCKEYNSTYSHKSFSFESALIDGMTEIDEGNIKNCLIIGADETVTSYIDIINKMDKKYGGKNLTLGSGCGSFIISKDPFKNENTRVMVKKVLLLVEANNEKAKESINEVLMDLKIKPDLTISNFENSQGFNYSEYCGEYHTSTTFALALGWNLITNNKELKGLATGVNLENCNNILIHRIYQKRFHSVILLGKQ